MKILVAGSEFPDSFERNILVTLRTMGHDAEIVPVTGAYHHQNRLAYFFWKYPPLVFPLIKAAFHKRLIGRARSFQPDLVLLTSGLPPELIRSIREVSSAKIACWFTDAISNFYRGYLVAGAYDALFVKEPFIVPILREKLGLNAFMLPEACNPMWHKPVALTPGDQLEFGCDLAGIGTLHYYRARMFEPFIDYDLKIWGNNCPYWIDSPTRAKYQMRSVAEETKARALGAAKIVLNPMYYTEIDGVNCSLFEIAGCGAFQITDDKPSLRQFFEPGIEIETFASREELKDKIDFYLAHPEQRANIAQNGRLRAHRDHTYQIRLSSLLSQTGLLSNPAPGRPEAPPVA